MSTAAIYYLPFNEQIVTPEQVPPHIVEGDVTGDIPIENLQQVVDAMPWDIKPDLSAAFKRVQEKYNSHLDDEAREDALLLELSNPANPAGSVTVMKDFKRAKETAKMVASFDALRDGRRVRDAEGLKRFMKNARSYGGADGVDYDLAQEYRLVQGFFAEALRNIEGLHVV